MNTIKSEHFNLLYKEWDSLINPKTGLVYKRLVERINCPICASKKYNTIFVKKGFNFVKCSRCAHVFINPQLKRSVLDRHFKNSRAWDVWSKKVLLAKSQLPFDLQKYKTALREIRNLSGKRKNLALLDIGCSSGVFLDLARKKCWRVYGIEPSNAPAEFARRHFHLNVFEGYFRDFKTDVKFDLITFWASLEYENDVVGAIAKADKLLKKGGLLLILTSGNSHSLVMRLLQGNCVGFLFNRAHYFSPYSLDFLVGHFKYKLLLRYSIIPEIDAIFNYLNYEDPYRPRIESKIFSSGEKNVLQALMKKNNMGYKFISIYRKI